jgi:aromatic ring-opening dioxygenase catalytic subunit (LigB family)
MAKVTMVWASAHAPMMLAARDSAPADQRERFFGAHASLRHEIQQRRLDAVVVCSNEHFTNFFLDNFPAWCMGVGERHFGPVERWLGVPQGYVPGHPALAAHLLASCVEQGFEPSISHELKLDHGIVTVYREADPSGALPLVPIVMNCAVAPMPTLRRCLEFGRALRRAIESFPGDLRVGVLGAGGLSHSVGTPDVGRIDEDFDHWFLERLAEGDLDALCEVPNHELELAGNGTHEVRAWLTAAGAAGGNSRAKVLAYEPVRAWINGMGVVQFI